MGGNGKQEADRSKLPAPGAREEHRHRQRQARALGDPGRYRIFRLVAESGPLGVAAIATELGLNHNAIRQHLTKLCEAGLLIEDVARQGGPGRPRLQYRLAPGVAGTWGTSGPYEQLSLMLLELLKGKWTPRQVGAAVGRHSVAAVPAVGRPLEVLESELAKQGFEPERVHNEDGVDLRLRRCPFAAAAAVNPEVVCELHQGIVEGIINALDGALELVDFLRDPRHMGCRLRVGDRLPDRSSGT